MTGRRADGVGDVERVLGRVLLAGSTTSTVVLALGLAVWLIWPEAAAGNWGLRAGLIVLMATPALRVLVSVVEYTRLREWLFAGLTLIVLAVLAGSLAVALIN